MKVPGQIDGIWTLVTPKGNRYHGSSPLECCRSEQTDRILLQPNNKKGPLDIFDALAPVYDKKVIELWRKPAGEIPEGNLLVEFDLTSGESEIALVFIGDDGETLYYSDEFEDVYSNWAWSDVSRYAIIEELLPPR